MKLHNLTSFKCWKEIEEHLNTNPGISKMQNTSEFSAVFSYEVITKMQSLNNASLSRIIVPKSRSTPLPYTLVYAVLAVLVIISNGLIIAIFLKNREVRKRKSHLFLLSLSCADFLVGFSSLSYIFTIKSETLSVYSKRVSTIVLTFSLETSMFSLWCLTYDRLVAIRNSLNYQRLVTSKTVIAAIILTWLISTVLTGAQGTLAFMIEDGKYFELNGVIIVAFALITSVFLAAVYLYLYKEIKRHRRDIRSKSVSVSNSIDIDMLPTIKSAEDILDINMSDFELNQESMLRERKSKRLLVKLSKEKRSLIFCSFIVCSFIICWTPITVFFAGVFLRIDYMSQDFMLYICTNLVLLNSLLNPIIYFGLRKDMRRAAAIVLCK